MRLIVLVTFLAWALAVRPASAEAYFLTVAGLGGEPDYEREFSALAADLDRTLKGPEAHVYTLSGEDASRAQLIHTLQLIAGLAQPADEFVLILIGHGSFDGIDYKFNLVGPDISAAALAGLCNRIAARRQLIINTTSASGGSIPVLARGGRAVIAATKSGTEKNATIFARYFVDALQDPTADLDKNDAISALEAFEYATAKTAAFYEAQKRLATEHAVFVDTPNAAPVRAASTQTGAGRFLSSLVLVRLGAARTAAADPAKRQLLDQKEQLERRIDTLKYQRAAMSAEDYKRELTDALVQLAKIEQQLEP
ncbi:MAG TPA: hypothetical protein VMU40_20130 [Steroidobacteraceae bacterium]|nr:hypothetical protein [Steroidobacteraceae bacterium]